MNSRKSQRNPSDSDEPGRFDLPFDKDNVDKSRRTYSPFSSPTMPGDLVPPDDQIFIQSESHDGQYDHWGHRPSGPKRLPKHEATDDAIVIGKELLEIFDEIGVSKEEVVGILLEKLSDEQKNKLLAKLVKNPPRGTHISTMEYADELDKGNKSDRSWTSTKYIVFLILIGVSVTSLIFLVSIIGYKTLTSDASADGALSSLSSMVADVFRVIMTDGR